MTNSNDLIKCSSRSVYGFNIGKLFNEAFNWLAEYKPNEKIEFIKFQLQGCKYKVKNNRANILGFFRRLKNLNKKHYENWSFKKFLKKVH